MSYKPADGGSDLIFTKTVDHVQPGEYEYKFRLGPGDWWVLDETTDVGEHERSNLIYVEGKAKTWVVTNNAGIRNNRIIVHSSHVLDMHAASQNASDASTKVDESPKSFAEMAASKKAAPQNTDSGSMKQEHTVQPTPIKPEIIRKPEGQARSGPRPLDASSVTSSTDSWAQVATDPPDTHLAIPELEGQHRLQEALNNPAAISSSPDSAKNVATPPEEHVPVAKKTLYSTTTEDADVAGQSVDSSQTKISQDAGSAVEDTKQKADDVKKGIKDTLHATGETVSSTETEVQDASRKRTNEGHPIGAPAAFQSAQGTEQSADKIAKETATEIKEKTAQEVKQIAESSKQGTAAVMMETQKASKEVMQAVDQSIEHAEVNASQNVEETKQSAKTSAKYVTELMQKGIDQANKNARIPETAKDMQSQVPANMEELKEYAQHAATQGAQETQKVIDDATHKANNAIETGQANVPESAEEAKKNAHAVATDGADNVDQAATATSETFKQSVGDLQSKVQDSANQTVAHVQESASQMADQVHGATQSAVEDTKMGMNKINSSAPQSVSEAADVVKSAVASVAATAQQLAQPVIDKAQEVVEPAAKSVQAAMSDVQESAEEGTNSSQEIVHLMSNDGKQITTNTKVALEEASNETKQRSKASTDDVATERNEATKTKNSGVSNSAEGAKTRDDPIRLRTMAKRIVINYLLIPLDNWLINKFGGGKQVTSVSIGRFVEFL